MSGPIVAHVLVSPSPWLIPGILDWALLLLVAFAACS